MQIGTFTKTTDGEFTGQIETLTLSQDIMFISVKDKGSDKEPDYKILVEATHQEIGAGWNALSKDDKPYIKTKLDDPSFPNTLWGALTSNNDGEYNLLWSRPKASPKKSKSETTIL